MREYNYRYDLGSCLLPNSYGFNEDVKIYFTNEKLDVFVYADGRTIFKNEVVNEIFIDPKTYHHKHIGGYVKKEEDKINVYFPLLEEIDHYPHCDGEYDRYSHRKIGYHKVSFDLNTYQIEVKEEKNV